MKARTGLYWNRRGELYYCKVADDGQTFRITNCTTCTETPSQLLEQLQHHIDVGWFVPVTDSDLMAGYGNRQWYDRVNEAKS